MANNIRAKLRQRHEECVYRIQLYKHLIHSYELEKEELEKKIKEIDDKGEGFV